MLQKIIFESLKSKNKEKSLSSKKNYSYTNSSNSSILTKKILYKKYSQFRYSFSLFCTNNLIFNEKCRIVARFKDYLVYDDSTEFLRRFYLKRELRSRLKQIYNFYESYCKIFPNYMILPESQFLYRNIRKKQKMIDAFNEIKREEEENRRHLKIGLHSDKKKRENIVFTKKIQESIERYHPSLSNILSNTFMSEINNNKNLNNNENDINDKSIISLSLNSQKPFNINDINNFSAKDFNDSDKFFTPNRGSFAEKNFNDNPNNSQNSIFKIVQILSNDKNSNNNIPYLNNDVYDNGHNKNKAIKKDFKNNNSLVNSNKKKNNNNNLKNNNKKNMIYMNTINTNSHHNKINVHTNQKNNSNNKKKKQEPNVTNKINFISHKQTISVPLASNMLNNNTNNILEEDNTIKIINNINNIIINDDKNKTINNGMIININNNYFQLKDSKKVLNNIIKRVKSKEEKKKEKSKDNKISKEQKYKIFGEKRTYTAYNTQNNHKENKKFLINEIQSPKIKKINYQGTEKKKNISSTHYILTMNNNNKDNNSNIYRNKNGLNDKKNSKKLIQSKALFTSQNINNTKLKSSKNNNTNYNTINNHNIAITETNATISSYNQNKISNKLNLVNKNHKEIPKLEGVESIDKKKLSINRLKVNNYLTTTQKKKTFQGRFHVKENSVSNNIISKAKLEENMNNNTTNEKMELLNICNTVENKNEPKRIKLNKKNINKKKKTNSLQINNKNEFLSSFNFPKDKIIGNNIDIDVINIEGNRIKYRKKSLSKLINNNTQTNSEAELNKDNNFISKKNNQLNTINNKSITKDKNNAKIKQNNEINIKNNYEKIENPEEMKKINVKEMKEKYHKLIRGNKLNHGSYDIANRIPLYKKFRGLHKIMDNVTNSINSTINTYITNKRSPLVKKSVLSPSERIQNNVSNFIKTPNKMMHEERNKEFTTIEVTNNFRNKIKIIGNKNKQVDSNNKKMKFLKK